MSSQTPSLSSSYETKRKTQNREAQRRYRQRLKRSQDKLPEQVSSPLFAIDGPTNFAHAMDPIQFPRQDVLEPLHVSRGRPNHARNTSTDTFDSLPGHGSQNGTIYASEAEPLSEASLQLSASLPSTCLSPIDFELSDSRWVPVPSPSSRNASNLIGRRHSSTGTNHADLKALQGYRCPCRAYTAPGSKSTSHDKIVAKASNMIEELQKLYEFGVDIDLLVDDDEISNCLESLDALFHRSSQAAMAHNVDATD